jgi:hypothetical protein
MQDFFNESIEQDTSGDFIKKAPRMLNNSDQEDIFESKNKI